VAYVLRVRSDGSVVVEEYNWTHLYAYDQRVTRGPRYIHFKSAAASSPAPAPVSNQQPGVTYRTTANLHQRTAPSLAAGVVGVLPYNTAIAISCQARSSSNVNGSTIWDRLPDGSYVSDYYTTTPIYNGFSPGLKRC
jgi:hypothetical protein